MPIFPLILSVNLSLLTEVFVALFVTELSAKSCDRKVFSTPTSTVSKENSDIFSGNKVIKNSVWLSKFLKSSCDIFLISFTASRISGVNNSGLFL